MNILTHRFLQVDSYETFIKDGIIKDNDMNTPLLSTNYYYEWYYSYVKKMLAPVKRILEIGVFKAYSAAVFAIAAEECGCNISYLGIDNASYGQNPIENLNRISKILQI